METIKKIGNAIKVVLTQLIAFVLSFFKTEKKDEKNLKKDERPTISTIDTKKSTIISRDTSALPDEPDTKSDNHLSYKQSISTIDKEKKEDIKNKVNTKEIYFSEIVIINTIVEVIEEKNNFIFSELSERKKEKIKEEVEKINTKITPSIKKEMLNNKIKTKEELKDNIVKKINNMHYNYNPIKIILNTKDEPVEEEKSEIKIENKELNIKPVESKKPEKTDRIITIAPRKKETDTNTEDQEKQKEEKDDFITIKKKKKIAKEDKVYFIADILPDKKKEIKFPEKVQINTKKNLLSEAKRETAQAMAIKSEKLPFIMIPTDTENKPPAKDRIKNAIIDTTLLLSTIPLQKEAKEEKIDKEDKEIISNTPPKKTIYKTEEDDISPEEKKIADIAVDREILENIKEDLKKQQHILDPIIEEAKEQTNKKEPEEKEKQDSINKIEVVSEDIPSGKNDISEEKEDKEENLSTQTHEEYRKQEEISFINLPTIEENQEESKHKEQTKTEEKEEVINSKPTEEENIVIPLPTEDKEIDAELTPPKETENAEITEKNENNEDEKTNPTEKKEKATLSISITTKEKEEKNDSKELKELHRKTETTIINTNNEIRKEELEDKDYDKYEKQIDDLLYDIEMYKIKNEDTLTPSDREKLNQEKHKLKSLKNKLENQKEMDIEQEKRELEAELTENEIQNIQEEIKKLHVDHQEEANEVIMAKIAKLEAINDEKIAELEQQLIKSKLKKAAKAAEIPSILALPFIRHKYFFYFTIGLFVNNHFNFLNAIFKRKVVKYEPIDLTEIKNGYDALEQAIDKNYENIVYLDYLENEAITKYPNLQNDKEFTKIIEKLRNRLNKNYDKLLKKQKMINKYIKKVNKKNKVLKKYKLIKENKDA